MNLDGYMNACKQLGPQLLSFSRRENLDHVNIGSDSIYSLSAATTATPSDTFDVKAFGSFDEWLDAFAREEVKDLSQLSAVDTTSMPLEASSIFRNPESVFRTRPSSEIDENIAINVEGLRPVGDAKQHSRTERIRCEGKLAYEIFQTLDERGEHQAPPLLLV